jgi:hypothetical protein
VNYWRAVCALIGLIAAVRGADRVLLERPLVEEADLLAGLAHATASR